MSNSVRVAARSLRKLATRLDNGEFDRVDLSQMCPMVTDGRYERPLPMLVVNMVAWKAKEERDRDETKGNTAGNNEIPISADCLA